MCGHRDSEFPHKSAFDFKSIKVKHNGKLSWSVITPMNNVYRHYHDSNKRRSDYDEQEKQLYCVLHDKWPDTFTLIGEFQTDVLSESEIRGNEHKVFEVEGIKEDIYSYISGKGKPNQ